MDKDEDKTIEQLNEEADIAADYLEGLLDIADYDGDIEMGIRNKRPTLQIVADDSDDIKNLIGHNGEVVDALQQLTRLAVQQKTGERSHLILDIDGYLKRKRQRLQDIAMDAVDEVRDTGEPVDLKPMNSFERKVVHDLVREEGLKSRSHGEEPHRYVSVYMRTVERDAELADADAAIDSEGEFVDDMGGVRDDSRDGAHSSSPDASSDEQNAQDVNIEHVITVEDVHNASNPQVSEESAQNNESDSDSDDDDMDINEFDDEEVEVIDETVDVDFVDHEDEVSQ